MSYMKTSSPAKASSTVDQAMANQEQNLEYNMKELLATCQAVVQSRSNEHIAPGLADKVLSWLERTRRKVCNVMYRGSDRDKSGRFSRVTLYAPIATLDVKQIIEPTGSSFLSVDFLNGACSSDVRSKINKLIGEYNRKVKLPIPGRSSEQDEPVNVWDYVSFQLSLLGNFHLIPDALTDDERAILDDDESSG